MTVDMEKYKELLQQFEEISQSHINREVLEKLKEKYKIEINSKRELSSINNIISLLKVLEKRGVLEYDDITVLKDISNLLIGENCVRDETIKQQISDLIENYEQWFRQNTGSIKFFYNSGKSNVLLVSHECIIPKTSLQESETASLYNNVDEILKTSIEDMTKESLLKNESLNNLNTAENEKDTDRNKFFVNNLRNCPLNSTKRKDPIILIILILIFILIGIILILIKLSHQSSAVVPGNLSIQTAPEQSHLNMPFHMPNDSASYSTQTTYSVHHTHSVHYTTSTVPPVDKDKELQKIVVKEVSKRIGEAWKDVIRGLDIDENTIDEITIEYSRVPSQKYLKMFEKGMEIYFSTPRPKWKKELRNALRLAGRENLEKKVEETIEDHSNL